METRSKALVVVGLAGAAAAAGLAIYRFASAGQAPAFRFTTVDRGDIQALVSATGTLQAVTTVSVGTQVSGQISALLVDFNDHVRKGQLLARIDPTIAQQGVADAQANLEKARAQALQARSDQDRNRELSSAGLIAGSALEQGGSALKVAEATVRSASVALERAKQNLSFTSIYAPIDGVVVERNVDNGQTVAASLFAASSFFQRPSTRTPSSAYDPDVGVSRHPIMFISVDFPEPDAPMIATSSPRVTFRSTSLRA
jgi:HlyD family secretion protein